MGITKPCATTWNSNLYYCLSGNIEAYHFGYHRAAEIGQELGYYSIITAHLLETQQAASEEKLTKLLTALSGRIDSFPRDNRADVDYVNELNQIRSLFKRCCIGAKFKSATYPKKDTISF